METEEEWNFMNDAIQRRNTKSFENKWSIGLTKEKKGGNWTWVHGRPLTICKWGQGEPSGEHDAAFIYKRSRNGERGVVVEEQSGKTMTLIFVKFPRVSRPFCVCCFSSIILSKLSGTRIY